MYNFSQVGSDRKWLQDILLSDTESEGEISDENEYIRDMLRDHMKEQKFRTKYYQNANVRIFPAYIVRCTKFFFLFTERPIRLLRNWSVV